MMHTGAAEDNERNNGHQQVPIDSFDGEQTVYLRLYLDYFEKKGLDVVQMIIYLFELMSRKDLKKNEKITYSKKFFTRYYFVNAETFNKWIELFYPELYSDNFKTKRNFTDEEANLIFAKLGTLSNDELLPATRKELISKLPDTGKWKKSKNYKSIQVVLDEQSNQYDHLNKLPPILIKKILFEETFDPKYQVNTRDLKLEKDVQSIILFMEYYFPNYTEWQWTIRRRWLRRFFNKP